MKRQVICACLAIFIIYNILSISSSLYYYLQSLYQHHEINIELNSPLNNTLNEIQLSDQKKISIKIQILQTPPTELNSTKICSFPEYNFSSEEELKIWNYSKYPNCKTESKDLVYIDKDSIVAKCQDNLIPDFAENLKIPEKLGGNRKAIPKWVPFASNTSLIDFVFVRCRLKSIYSFVFLRPSLTASEKAKKNAETIRSEYNFTENDMTSVLLLTFDSVSRGSAYRNLKESMKFLKSEQDNFISYEFLNPGVPELHTQDNIAQILFGETRYKIQKKIGTRLPFSLTKAYLEHQKRAIWSHYSRLGYVTMLLHDSVWDYLTSLTGSDILADHVLANYWKMVWTVYGFHDHQDGQRCIGTQNSHNISFTYIYDFFNIYPHNNKFSYVHLDAAHENSGNIQTVDDDLHNFLKSLINLFNSRNETFLIFLIGDHGQKRKRMQFDIRNRYEGAQPLSFIITSNHLSQYKETLSHNSKHLFSRYDLHLTLKDFSFYPYTKNSESIYSELKKDLEVNDVVSLLKYKISPNRKCQDIGVPFEHCPCSEFVQASSESDLNLLEDGFLPIIYKILIMNSIDCSNQTEICVYQIFDYQKFVMNSVDDGGDVLYDLMIKFNETQIVQIKIRGCTEDKIKETKNVIEGKLYQSIIYVYGSVKMFYQVYWVDFRKID